MTSLQCSHRARQSLGGSAKHQAMKSWSSLSLLLCCLAAACAATAAASDATAHPRLTMKRLSPKGLGAPAAATGAATDGERASERASLCPRRALLCWGACRELELLHATGTHAI